MKYYVISYPLDIPVGLLNNSNNCFANVVVIALYYMDELRSFVLGFVSDNEEYPYINSLKICFQQLNARDLICPKALLDTLLREGFVGYRMGLQMDAAELYQHIFADTLVRLNENNVSAFSTIFLKYGTTAYTIVR